MTNFSAKFCLMVNLASLLGACACRLPTDYPKAATTSLQEFESTRAHAYFEDPVSEPPGRPGFLLVPNGRYAFTDRIERIAFMIQGDD